MAAADWLLHLGGLLSIGLIRSVAASLYMRLGLPQQVQTRLSIDSCHWPRPLFFLLRLTIDYLFQQIRRPLLGRQQPVVDFYYSRCEI